MPLPFNTWLSGFSTTPSVPQVLFSDTIRGGKFLVFSGSPVFLDTSRDRSLLAPTLPAGWSTFTTGSGAVRATLDGLELDTGLAASSTAGLVSTANDYLTFDVAIDVDVIYPVGATPSPVDLAVLEARSISGAIARVRLRRGWGLDPKLTVGYGDITPVSDPPFTGGIVDAGSVIEPFTLRIVRYKNQVFGFVGRRSSDGSYSVLEEVLSWDKFPTDAGTIRFYIGNVGFGGRVLSRFSNYTVRSHVLIQPRLLVDKLDISTHRLAGNVPAATVHELGRTDLVIFGLFGEVVFPLGFEYVLPSEKTLGRETARTLFTVQDPVLRDGT